MICRDADALLPMFFDGELDAKRMRDVAMHTTRCGDCEGKLRDLESVQGHLQALLAAEVDAVDMSGLWAAIEKRLPPPEAGWWLRLRNWWENLEPMEWNVALPATAAATAIVVLTSVALWQNEPSGENFAAVDAQHVASTDYATGIERLETTFDSVAVLSDPDTHTTVLWIGDDSLFMEDALPIEEVMEFE